MQVFLLPEIQPQGHQLSLSPGALLEKEVTAKKTAQNQQGWGNFCHQQQHTSSRGTGSHLPAVYHQGREICIKFQSASCSFPNCRWALLQNVILQAQSPLNLDSFSCYLACHPNRQWSDSLLQGIHEGVDIGYQGVRKLFGQGTGSQCWTMVSGQRLPRH